MVVDDFENPFDEPFSSRDSIVKNRSKYKQNRDNQPQGLKKFAENMGPWLKLQSVKQHPAGVDDIGYVVAKFHYSNEDLKRVGFCGYDLHRIAKECGALGVSIYSDSYNTKEMMWAKVSFPCNTRPVKKETKKMNEDTEFYLALLQSSGVKMVVVFLGKQEYNYLCAIDVKKGDHVVIQARDQLMVGEVEEVLEEWDMDIVENLDGELKWIINTVDVSNVKLYEDQKKQVFRELRQSRLVEKAKKFAGNANLDFNSLVQKTQNSLAIEHSNVVYETPPSAPGSTS